MKLISTLIVSVLAVATSTSLVFETSADTTPTKQPIPKARIIAQGTQLELQWPKTSYTIQARDLNVQVLDAIDCSKVKIVPRQVLKAKRFVSNTALDVDPKTGNVAVGALLQECVETQVSAVFVIEPEPNGHAIYRVQVPGKRPLPNEFSTYPLNSITRVKYLDADLLVKQSDAAGSSALLVFTPSTTPAGKYSGCILTQKVEGDRLCPSAR